MACEFPVAVKSKVDASCYTLVTLLFRSTPRPNKVGSQISVRRPSTKCFFDFNEIWYVGRGRQVMHGGMQYDPIHGQVQGHEPSKFGNSALFNGYLFPIYNGGWQLITDS